MNGTQHDVDIRPILSVIIPTHRRTASLSACLERLAPGSQTLPKNRYEVIVSDDGFATPDSAEALVRNTYLWAEWIPGPRRGPAANRNAGARLAQSPWLVFTDDDCLPDPEWLQAYRDAITAAEAAGDARHVFEGRTLCRAGLTSPLDHAPVNIDGGLLWSCNMAIRKSTFEEIGGFDENFPYAHMEDIDLRERLTRRGIGFDFVPEAVVDHPPARYTWRAAFGPYAESDLMFWYKQGRPGPHFARLLRQIILFRLSWLRSAARAPHSLLPIGFISFREILHVLLYGASWDRKYRARFGPPTSLP